MKSALHVVWESRSIHYLPRGATLPQMTKPQTLVALAALMIVALVLSGCANGASDGGTGAGNGGPGDAAVGIAADAQRGDSAAVLIADRCTVCHDLRRIEAKDDDRDGWLETIGRMRGRGAQVNDSEASQIANYLAGRE